MDSLLVTMKARSKGRGYWRRLAMQPHANIYEDDDESPDNLKSGHSQDPTDSNISPMNVPGTSSALLEISPNTLLKHDLSQIEDKDEMNGARTIARQEEYAVLFANNQTQKEKNRKHLLKYTLNQTPFPQLAHPTTYDCERICTVLRAAHGRYQAPKRLPKSSPEVCACGEVDDLLEALMRAHMSINATMENTDDAYKALYKAYPVIKDGPVAGTLNWEAVRTGPAEKLKAAIVIAGMKHVKTTQILSILNHTKIENGIKRMQLQQKGIVRQDGRYARIPSGVGKTRAAKMADIGREILLYQPDVLTLNYIYELAPADAMERLMIYDGVGPKWRLAYCSFWLGWTKAVGKDATKTFYHMNFAVPDHLKYELHQLLIVHGQECPRCHTIIDPDGKDWEQGCVIEQYLTRFGQLKTGEKKPPATKRKAENGGGKKGAKSEGNAETGLKKSKLEGATG